MCTEHSMLRKKEQHGTESDILIMNYQGTYMQICNDK